MQSGHQEALFRSMDPTGSANWIAIHDIDEDIAGRLHTVWGGDAEVSRYREIFAGEGAREISDSERFIFLVRVNVDAALDNRAFNEWYDHVHIPEVASAGLQRGRRFQRDDLQWPYLTLYEIAEPAVVHGPELNRVRGFAQFTPLVTALERTIAERVE
jgi:hypothetical protein